MERVRPIQVSLIIPVYNGEAYLRECLDSVLVPAPACEVEIICVNDGSTDGSAALLEEYAAQHPLVTVIHQPHGGPSAARNAALTRARGEYVQFLDCDDRLAPGALDRLYRQAHEQRLDVLYFDGESFFDREQYQQSHRRYEQIYHTKVPVRDVLPGERMFVTLCEGRSFRVSVCMQMLRRAFLEEQSLTFIDGILYEDNPFTFHSMLRAGRTALCAAPLYQRRLRDGSTVTSRKNDFHVRSQMIAYQAIKDFVSQNAYAPDVTLNIDVQLASLLQQARAAYALLTDEETRKLAADPDFVWMQPLLNAPASPAEASPLLRKLRACYGRMLDNRCFFVLSKPLRALLRTVRQTVRRS